VTYQAIPREIFALETDRDKEEATAEVKKGMKNPWHSLKLFKTLILEVLAQARCNTIKRMAAVRHALVKFFLSSRTPEGMHPKVMPANTKDTVKDD
tara:strand:- start:1356 stop:1643 length:288 start_codon:yes stop_codon:yes gene_type:complete